MIIDSAHYVDGARQDEGLSVSEAGRRAADGGGFVWLAVADASADELEELRRSFHLPPLAVEDAAEGHQRPKLERYRESEFLVVKTVRYDEARTQLELGEFDVFLGAHYAIVTTKGSALTLRGARERLDDRQEIARIGPTAAGWAVLDAVVDAYEVALDHLGDDLEQAELAVFQQRLDQGETIYLQRRQAARLERAVHPLLGVFDRLERGEPELPEHLLALLRDVGDHVRRLSEETVMLAEALDALLSTNLASVTVRQNQVVQKVSGWAAIAAVPTIITGIYGMNFREMPELGWAIGYPLALAVMVAVVVGLRLYFKHVGWF
jgi:magnesium transporter